MTTTPFDDIHCSVARTAGVAGDPWSLLIIRDLFLGLATYDQLHQDLGISTNVLASRLEKLVHEGIVDKHEYSAHPPRFEYHLTPSGLELYGVVLAMIAWGDRHRAEEGAPMRLVHDSCGAFTTAKVTCSDCGEELQPGHVGTVAGPGGRIARGTAVIGTLLSQGRIN